MHSNTQMKISNYSNALEELQEKLLKAKNNLRLNINQISNSRKNRKVLYVHT